VASNDLSVTSAYDVASQIFHPFVVNMKYGGCKEMDIDVSGCYNKKKKKIYFAIWNYDNISRTKSNVYLYLDAYE
jgi:hypothetical protein